jgi:hypothetical protein
METPRGWVLLIWWALAVALRFVLSFWLLGAAVAITAVAHGDTMRARNYNSCDAQSAIAFAHDDLDDMAGSSFKKRAILGELEDNIRRACMEGKAYEIAGTDQCMPSLGSGRAVSITPLDCFHRSWGGAFSAQVN